MYRESYRVNGAAAVRRSRHDLRRRAPSIGPWQTAFALPMVWTMCATVAGFSFARSLYRYRSYQRSIGPAWWRARAGVPPARASHKPTSMPRAVAVEPKPVRRTPMAETQKTVEQLNSFLRGQICAVETYRQALQALKSSTF